MFSHRAGSHDRLPERNCSVGNVTRAVSRYRRTRSQNDRGRTKRGNRTASTVMVYTVPCLRVQRKSAPNGEGRTLRVNIGTTRSSRGAGRDDFVPFTTYGTNRGLRVRIKRRCRRRIPVNRFFSPTGNYAELVTTPGKVENGFSRVYFGRNRCRSNR